MDILTLIRSYVEGLLEAEDRFIEHLDSFPDLEKTVVELSNRMAAGFLGAVLTTADDLICESGIRKKEYTVQRKRMRTLISSVGDVTFTHTLYKDKQGQTKCLLDDQIRLPDRERFTTLAEAKVLSEAEVHSYQHAADSIRTGSTRPRASGTTTTDSGASTRRRSRIRRSSSRFSATSGGRAGFRRN